MTRPPLRLLIFALAVAAIPLVFTLPIWTTIWLIVCWGYGLLADRRGWAVLPRWVRLCAFLLAIAITLGTAGLRFGGNNFIALLAVMAGLKPLEVRSYRDSMITVFLAYFLVITSLFVFENLFMIGYLFVSVWCTTAVLIQINSPHGNIGSQLRLAGRFILVAIPLTALMFVLFPRLSGGFWRAPWQGQNYSGFTSSISIGDVGQIALSDAPAFAVTFGEGTMPTANQLYWRGIVFRYFDGRTWYPPRHLEERIQSPRGEQSVTYTVIMEPTGQPYLFVLDLPLRAEAFAASIKNNNTLHARRAVEQRLRYRAVSVLDYSERAGREVNQRYLQLPENFNPQTLALGRSWRQANQSPEAIIKGALTYFQEQGFIYSLQPGKLGRNAVDEFLFTTRNGFCEHYATAFAVLMRAAGIPARLVGGYQGGTWNDLGGFLSVRQSDAHVWCEVWLPEHGWMRVDPTAAVVPGRIARGDIDGELTNAQDESQVFLPLRWYRNLRETWEAINTRWNMWFMSFSAEDQLAILQQFGLSLGRKSQWLLLLTLPLAFVAITAFGFRLWRLQAVKRRQDSNLKIYRRFLTKMRDIGLSKAAYQGPLAYAEDVTEKFPSLQEAVHSITKLYIALRYSPLSSDAAASKYKEFRTLVRQFQPKKLLKTGNE